MNSDAPRCSLGSVEVASYHACGSWGSGHSATSTGEAQPSPPISLGSAYWYGLLDLTKNLCAAFGRSERLRHHAHANPHTHQPAQRVGREFCGTGCDWFNVGPATEGRRSCAQYDQAWLCERNHVAWAVYCRIDMFETIFLYSRLRRWAG
jgi:hypothetical protein